MEAIGARAGSALRTAPAPRIAVLAVQGAFAEHERRLQQLGCTCVELRQAADLARPFDALVLPGGESTVQAKLLRDAGMLEQLRELIGAGLPTLATCAGLILLAERVQEAPADRHDGVARKGDSPRANAAEPGNARPEASGNRCASAGSDLVEDRNDAGRPAEEAPGALATLPVTVLRNAYGRQLGSFRAIGVFEAGYAMAQAMRQPAASASQAEDPQADVPMTFIRAPRIVATGDGVRTLATLEGGAVAVQYRNQIACAFHPELDDDETVYRLFLSLLPQPPLP